MSVSPIRSAVLRQVRLGSAYNTFHSVAKPSLITRKDVRSPNYQLRRGLQQTSTMSSKYPSRDEIEKIFKHMETGDFASTFERVSPDVDWTVMGTHPCAGRYSSLKDFQKSTITRLGNIMKEPGIRLMVRNVIGGGDQEWATVELIAAAECKSGESVPVESFFQFYSDV